MSLQRSFIFGALTGIISGGGVGVAYILFFVNFVMGEIPEGKGSFFEILMGILKMPFGNFFLFFIFVGIAIGFSISLTFNRWKSWKIFILGTLSGFTIIFGWAVLKNDTMPILASVIFSGSLTSWEIFLFGKLTRSRSKGRAL